MNRSPAFQFYPDKWQSHTRRLSDSAYRVYHELICWMWRSSEDYCSIQNSAEAVACAVAMQTECVRIALAEIQNPFAPLLKEEDGRLVSNGLRKARQAQENKSEKAKRSADARWKDANALRTHGPSNAETANPQCFPTPTPTPTLIKEDAPPSGGLEKQKPDADESGETVKAKEVTEAWNKLNGIPKCLSISEDRKRKLRVRLRDPFFAANWRAAMVKIQASAFCRGDNDRGWKASFDWFLQPDVCVKVMEGKYSGQPAAPKPRNGDYSESQPTNADLILAERNAWMNRNKPPEPIREIKLAIVKE